MHLKCTGTLWTPLKGAALVCSGFILFEMDLHDKAIVLQLSALFEELIEKESEKAVKPRKANKKVKKQRKSKKYQTRPWLLAERRQLHGHFQHLINELRKKTLKRFLTFLEGNSGGFRGGGMGGMHPPPPA